MTLSAPPQHPRRLRFGILCRNLVLQAWQVRCLDALLALPEVGLALVIRGVLPEEPAGGSFRRKVAALGGMGRILYHLYARRLLRPAATVKQDLTARLAGVPVVACEVRREGRFALCFSDGDLDAVRAYDLDFILLFNFGILRGGILEAARFGVWSFHHGDEQKYRGLPSCFWEIYHGDAATGAILQRLTERLDGGVLLRKGYFKTVLHAPARTKDDVYFGSSGWPAEVARDLLQGTAGYLGAPPSSTGAPVYRRPTNRQMLVFGARVLRNRLRHALHVLFRKEQWNLGVVDAPISSFLEGARPPVRWFPPPPRDTFVADPFGWTWEGEPYVLFECFSYRSQRGTIAAVPLDGSADTPIPVVFDDEPPASVHRSYPFLFEWEGAVYCVPECPVHREVRLYRAVDFPGRWAPAGVLLHDFAASDSTLFRHQDRWWLACTSRDHQTNVRLFLFHAPELAGPWQPHLRNPVKTDIRSSRPAGTPFRHGAHLYRPAQDSSAGYGSALVINRIRVLTPDAFEEEIVAVVRPDPAGPYRHGLHTLASLGERTLVDGKRYVYTLAPLAALLRRAVSRERRSTVYPVAP